MSQIANPFASYTLDAGNSNDPIGGFNGTDTSITYSGANAKLGANGAGFGGSSSIAVTVATGLSGSFTIYGWVKITITGVTQCIFNSNVASYSNYWAYLYVTGSQNVRFDMYDGTNNPGVQSSATLSTGVWYHVVAVRNTVADTLSIYIDGVLANTPVNDTTTSTPVYSAGSWGRRTNNVDGLTGSMDDMGLVSSAWSQAEVSQVYNSAIGNQYPFNNNVLGFEYLVATSASIGVTSKTIAHVFSGIDNNIVYAILMHTSVTTVSTVTCGGNAMTYVGAITQTAGNNTVELWQYVGASSGSQNIVCTMTSSTNISLGSISFVGAKQTGQPDASTTGGNVSTGVTSYAQNVTTVADQTMQVIALCCASGASITGGANTRIGSQPEVAAFGCAFAYSIITKTPAGTATLTVTSTSQVMVGVIASIKPNDTVSTFLPRIQRYTQAINRASTY